MKKVPLRMCIITKKQYPKSELFRIIKTSDGTINLDVTGKLNGHGVYIARNLETIELAKRTKILEKVLDGKIEDKLYEKMKLYL